MISTHVWNLKSKVKEQSKTEQKQTHRYREQTGGFQKRGRWGGWMKYFSLSLTCGMKLESLFFPDYIGLYIRILI